MGIRGKLALLVPGLVALTVTGVALGVTEAQRREQTREMRQRHEQLLEAVGVTAAAYVAQNDMAGLDALVANVSQQRLDPDLVELVVVNQDGRIIAHTDPTRFNERVDDAFTRRALTSVDPVSERSGDQLRIGVPANAGVRWATVTATYSLQRLNASIARSRGIWLLGAALLGLVICALLFSGLYRVVIRPVRTLTRVARRMGEGVLDERVPPLGAGELGELGETFNKMAAALKAQRENLEHAVAERTRELSEANQRLEKLAVTDGLTGVFNHRRFQEALAQEVLRASRTQRRFSVMMVDVDHFKRFNDTFGHPAGDELLRRLARTLEQELRATDLIARYGGEEFAVVLPDTDKDVALAAAERLRAAVEADLNVPGAEHKVTISVGLATYSADGDTPQAILIAADRALYAAKHSGRNRVVTAASALEQVG
ncbi:MAG: diguanylate cyclase [Myxococcaceae bacterium]|nr:diguanylate cyclase [Myxococcaceae bacterium]